MGTSVATGAQIQELVQAINALRQYWNFLNVVNVTASQVDSASLALILRPLAQHIHDLHGGPDDLLNPLAAHPDALRNSTITEAFCV